MEFATRHNPDRDMAGIATFLIGPKGAGKTHIGRVIEAGTGIPFLHVEKIWLELQKGGDGWDAVARAAEDLLQTHDQILMESLGLTTGFTCLVQTLAEKHCLRFVKVFAPSEVCLQRIARRNPLDHIPHSSEEIKKYNLQAAGVSLPWQLELVNYPPLRAESILEAWRHCNWTETF